MDQQGSAVVGIQPILADHYTASHFIKMEGTSFCKKGCRSTGKYIWPKHNIFILDGHALSVLRRHPKTAVLPPIYKLTCNYWTIFSFVRRYMYLMHLVSLMSSHCFLSWHYDFKISWTIPQCQSDHSTIFTPQYTAQYHSINTILQSSLIWYCIASVRRQVTRCLKCMDLTQD